MSAAPASLARKEATPITKASQTRRPAKKAPAKKAVHVSKAAKKAVAKEKAPRPEKTEAQKRTEQEAKEQAAAARYARLQKAQAEHKAHQEWVTNGKKGKEPTTATIEALKNGEKTEFEKTVKPKRTSKVLVNYFRNDKPVPPSMGLSHIAWHYSKGINRKDRINVTDFRKWLAKQGVTEPESTAWSVTLPSGDVLSTKLKAA